MKSSGSLSAVGQLVNLVARQSGEPPEIVWDTIILPMIPEDRYATVIDHLAAALRKPRG